MAQVPSPLNPGGFGTLVIPAAAMHTKRIASVAASRRLFISRLRGKAFRSLRVCFSSPSMVLTLGDLVEHHRRLPTLFQRLYFLFGELLVCRNSPGRAWPHGARLADVFPPPRTGARFHQFGGGVFRGVHFSFQLPAILIIRPYPNGRAAFRCCVNRLVTGAPKLL